MNTTSTLPSCITTMEDLSEHTYYRMGGQASLFARPKSFREVLEVLRFANEQSLPIAVLGSGSNSVFADGVFEGLVISCEFLNRWRWENRETLFCEGGVTNTEVAEICLAANRAGASWMFRMPGQIGATVRMNARCYGGEISQIATEITTVNENGVLETLTGSDVFKGYKNTLLMHEPRIVLSVKLKFTDAQAPEVLLKHMLECERDRHSKHHFDLPSCGSTFKNNYAVGRPSGRIFDELGLKGTRIGDAEISQFHANFVWNLGQAKTEDMLNLTAHMRQEAISRAKCELELEVQPIGNFSTQLYEKCGMQNLGPSFHEEGTQKSSEWVGLLKHPQKSFLPNLTFPYLLFKAPFQNYYLQTGKGIDGIGTSLEQILPISEARQSPHLPFLRWTTFCKNDFSAYFPIPVPQNLVSQSQFIPELWHHSVSELFLANPSQPTRYIELELTPNLEWIALSFQNIRTRAPGHQVPAERFWHNVERFSSSSDFGMLIPYENVEHLISKNRILVQGAYAPGFGRYYLAPHMEFAYLQETNRNFNAQNRRLPKEDFHQPQCYWPVSLL